MYISIVVGFRSVKSQLFDLSAVVSGSWRDLAESLNISNYDIEMIELEVNTKREQAYMMLCKWQSRVGVNAKIEMVKEKMQHIEEKKKAEAVYSKRIMM